MRVYVCLRLSGSIGFSGSEPDQLSRKGNKKRQARISLSSDIKTEFLLVSANAVASSPVSYQSLDCGISLKAIATLYPWELIRCSRFTLTRLSHRPTVEDSSRDVGTLDRPATSRNNFSTRFFYVRLSSQAITY
jgi:hypothetical protein